jgi:radical SAM superfamily enzyme YgiQ (UPF0313 family)
VSQKILLICPPFTQLNTPYPATAYLKGFLKTQNIPSTQLDLGMETILEIFSKKGLTQLFELSTPKLSKASENAQRIYALRDKYIATIDAVIYFLQDQDVTLGHFISQRNYLPEASKFEQLEDLEWAFGTMGTRDQSRHIATLYLEDISDYIVELIDPHFGFSRYAERLGIAANSFDTLHKELNHENSYISEIMLEILEDQIAKTKPTIVCFSVPFPGNLFSALKCAQYLKIHHPTIKIAMGGGYPNTELRSLTEKRVFEYVDFITLDDGERPILELLKHLDGKIEVTQLKRTFTLSEGKVCYHNGSLLPDITQEKVGTPDYSDLPLRKYLSVIQLTNPMHRLWSDGRWNKLTMAHGCYWGKCTFCDISLDYIKNYEASSAQLLVDRMEELIEETGETGFHFVDEAAPPALMKAISIEILKRKLNVSWWANIRFEKSFTYDLCRLLAASGCIAISGGLEVASDRLLTLIAKGVTIEQVALVNDNFNRAGIMVHAYLMYGFPTQTAQETIDSLEIVRQMFENGILQSAFWHRFAMTAHSPVGIDPKAFKVEAVNTELGAFANNDLEHLDPTGAKHGLFSTGLEKSLYNYMHGICFDYPLQRWFEHKVPKTTVKPNLIKNHLSNQNSWREVKASHTILWIGGPVEYVEKTKSLSIYTLNETLELECETKLGKCLVNTLSKCSSDSKAMSYSELQKHYEEFGLKDFSLFWYGEFAEELKEIGWLVV